MSYLPTNSTGLSSLTMASINRDSITRSDDRPFRSLALRPFCLDLTDGGRLGFGLEFGGWRSPVRQIEALFSEVLRWRSNAMGPAGNDPSSDGLGRFLHLIPAPIGDVASHVRNLDGLQAIKWEIFHYWIACAIG